MVKSKDKTNVMRILDQKKVEYKSYSFETDNQYSGIDVASIIGKDVEEVFKTLVTEGKSGANYVFIIPVHKELDLKKAAIAVDEKSIHMIKSKDLLGLTGYIHGGCSPIGMKKEFTKVFHNTVEALDTITFSGGKLGRQVELKASDLKKVIKFQVADLVVEG